VPVKRALAAVLPQLNEFDADVKLRWLPLASWQSGTAGIPPWVLVCFERSEMTEKIRRAASVMNGDSRFICAHR
jgi:hypothetical protein